jgi:hypothetical protein
MAAELKTVEITTLRVTNPGDEQVTFCLEPWAREYSLPPRSSLDVVFEAQSPGTPEVYHEPDRIVVYGWPGTTARVLRDGAEVLDEESSNDRDEKHLTDNYKSFGYPKGSRPSETTLLRHKIDRIIARGGATLADIIAEGGDKGLARLARNIRQGKAQVPGFTPKSKTAAVPASEKNAAVAALRALPSTTKIKHIADMNHLCD